MKFRLALAILLLAVVAVFSVQNAEVVDVRFLAWNLSMSRALLLFLAAVVGALAYWLFETIARIRK